MGTLWDRLRNEETRKIMGWLGGGVVAAVTAGWTLFTYLDEQKSDNAPSVQISASSGSVAVGGSVGAPITINTPPEQLAPLITAATAPLARLTEQQQTIIGELERKLGVSEGALQAFFRILGEEAVPPEKWDAKLAEIADHYRTLQQQVAAAPGDAPEIAGLKEQARAALDQGDLERADALLAQVIEAEDAAIDARRLQAAATAAQRGQIALTRLRYLEAATHFADAAARVPPGHENQLAYLDARAEALYRHGDERGDNEALKDAIGR